MKIIFSRKGVDSAAGKTASALVDGKPFSLPIPDGPTSPTKYAHLAEPLASMANDLSNGRLANEQLCHLDPDIDEASLTNRLFGWRGALGQAGPALSHLRNQGVGEGDLFLFWGLYRQVQKFDGRWRFNGPRRHCLFGWLKIGEIIDAGANGTNSLASNPWLIDHPHARDGRSGQNTIFVAADFCEFDGKMFPGSGVFRQAMMLSAEHSRLPSLWAIPIWLNPHLGGTGLSYHCPERFDGTFLQTVARGQEFVADIGQRSDAMTWIAQTLGDGS
jgi:hypothetical protein